MGRAFSPRIAFPETWGVAPGYYEGAPLALEDAPLALEGGRLPLEGAPLALEDAPLALEGGRLPLEGGPLAVEDAPLRRGLPNGATPRPIVAWGNAPGRDM